MNGNCICNCTRRGAPGITTVTAPRRRRERRNEYQSTPSEVLLLRQTRILFRGMYSIGMHKPGRSPLSARRQRKSAPDLNHVTLDPPYSKKLRSFCLGAATEYFTYRIERPQIKIFLGFPPCSWYLRQVCRSLCGFV